MALLGTKRVDEQFSVVVEALGVLAKRDHQSVDLRVSQFSGHRAVTISVIEGLDEHLIAEIASILPIVFLEVDDEASDRICTL